MCPIIFLAVSEVILFGTVDAIAVIFEHAFPVNVLGINPDSVDEAITQLLSGEMLVSILLGAAFIYGAIRLNRSEDL